MLAVRTAARSARPEPGTKVTRGHVTKQGSRLLRWALTNPLDRVMYTPLTPRKVDFDLVRDLMMETGVLDKTIEFSEYTDVSFAEGKKLRTAWKYEPGDAHAE